jgi:hypothetical protein
MKKRLIALMIGLASLVACAGPDQGISDAGTADMFGVWMRKDGTQGRQIALAKSHMIADGILVSNPIYTTSEIGIENYFEGSYGQAGIPSYIPTDGEKSLILWVNASDKWSRDPDYCPQSDYSLFRLDQNTALANQGLIPLRKINHADDSDESAFIINRLSAVEQSEAIVERMDDGIMFSSPSFNALEYRDSDGTTGNYADFLSCYATYDGDLYGQKFKEGGFPEPVVKQNVKNGEKETLFIPQGNIGRIWVYEDILFYTILNQYEQEVALYSYGIDDKKTIKLNDRGIIYLKYAHDRVYYNCFDDDNKINLYRQETNGSGKTAFNNNNGVKTLWAENVRNEWVYYIDAWNANTLYRFNLNTNEREMVDGNEKMDRMALYGNSIYYVSLFEADVPLRDMPADACTKMYKMNLDNKKKMLIAENVMIHSPIVFSDNHLYYYSQNASSEEKADVSLMRMDLRNDNIEAVASFE